MLNKPISDSERKYIITGCNDDVRFDGRGCQDFRTVKFENSIFPHVNGSSRYRIGDVIDVICSVKLEISEPLSATPNEGNLEVSVDLSPSCNMKLDERRLWDVAQNLSDTLER